METKQNGTETHAWGVVRSTDEACWVDTLTGGCLARRAASCLLEPCAGDKVLLSAPVDGTVYVLAVLERGAGVSTLRLPPVTRIAGTEVALEGRTLRMQAQDCRIAAESMTTHAREAELVADSVRQHARHVFRRTEETEEVHAGSLRTVVDSLYSLRCSVGRWIAKTLARIDGDQIQIG